MKIIFARDDPTQEWHARHLIRKQLLESDLPRIPAATRALEPTWCDTCGDKRAWGVKNGYAVCGECRLKDDKRPGF